MVLTFHPNDENVFIRFSVLVVRLAFHHNDENVFIRFSVYFLKGSEFSRSEFSRFGGSGFYKSEVKEAICTARPQGVCVILQY